MIMSRNLIKGVLLLACLTLVSMPLAAQKGGGGGGCATASVGTTPLTASPGQNFGIYGGISNCAGSKQRYLVEITITSACGVKTLLTSNVIRFDPFENRLISANANVPPDTCLGVATVTMAVWAGSQSLTSVSTPFTIK